MAVTLILSKLTNSGQAESRYFSIPTSFCPEIRASLGATALGKSLDFIFTMQVPQEFDLDSHLALVQHLFTTYPTKLKRIVEGETKDTEAVTYVLEGPDQVDSLSADDLVLAAAIMHHLRLKRLLVPLISVALNKHKANFEEFKNKVKTQYPVSIWTK